VTLIKINLNIKIRIMRSYFKDTAWKRVIKMLKKNRKLKKKNTIKLPFLQNDLNLIYYVDILGKRRLCVLKLIISEIFTIGHD